MKPRVAIGLTTYRDLKPPEYGEALYRAYAKASPKLTPHQVVVAMDRFPVTSAADLAANWYVPTAYELRASRGGPVIESGHYPIGAEWRTKGQLSGAGQVRFRRELDPRAPDTLTLSHNYSAKVDWVRLFSDLVPQVEPSYGMLHVFTERELSLAEQGARFAFTGPVAGEEQFTYWKSSIGDWRRPDSWQFEERRRYRFLPGLSWLNVLGPEFSDRYNPAALAREAARVETADGLVWVQLTNELSDVVLAPGKFEEARTRIKSAFDPDVFRS